MAEIDTDYLRGKLRLMETGTGAQLAMSRDIVLSRAGHMLDELERLRAENQRLRLEALTADLESMGLDAENQRLRAAVNDVRDLISESRGVAGLYLNGDVAEWPDLLPGGQHEDWLRTFGEVTAQEEGE